MTGMPIHKYRAFPPIDLPDRRWPARVIDARADLVQRRSARRQPGADRSHGPERKRRMFDLLVEAGLQGDRGRLSLGLADRFRFRARDHRRRLHPRRRHHPGADPGARGPHPPHLRGDPRQPRAPSCMSTTRPRRCSAASSSASTRPASPPSPSTAVKLIKELVPTVPETEIVLQYSPESFTGTELPYAVEICEAVMDAWQPTPARKMIFNLPVDRGDGDAQHLRRPDRVVRPQDQEPRQLHPAASTRTTTAAPASPRPSWR